MCPRIAFALEIALGILASIACWGVQRYVSSFMYYTEKGFFCERKERKTSAMRCPPRPLPQQTTAPRATTTGEIPLSTSLGFLLSSGAAIASLLALLSPRRASCVSFVSCRRLSGSSERWTAGWCTVRWRSWRCPGPQSKWNPILLTNAAAPSVRCVDEGTGVLLSSRRRRLRSFLPIPTFLFNKFPSPSSAVKVKEKEEGMKILCRSSYTVGYCTQRKAPLWCTYYASALRFHYAKSTPRPPFLKD